MLMNLRFIVCFLSTMLTNRAPHILHALVSLALRYEHCSHKPCTITKISFLTPLAGTTYGRFRELVGTGEGR